MREAYYPKAEGAKYYPGPGVREFAETLKSLLSLFSVPKPDVSDFSVNLLLVFSALFPRA